MNQLTFEDFVFLFGVNLHSVNPWVMLAKQIPWVEVETAYVQQFSEEGLVSPPRRRNLPWGFFSKKNTLV